jgi:hypothetical protein
MCPGCVSTLALIAAGVTSTGGITTLLVSRLRGKSARNAQDSRTESKRSEAWSSEREVWSNEEGIPQ